MKTRGQIAYEADLIAMPLYNDGSRRKTWEQLDDLTRESWERNPDARDWSKQQSLGFLWYWGA